MIVMALDISGHTGAAWDGPDGRPLFATYRLPRHFSTDDLGYRMQAFVQWLHPLVGMVGPGLVGVEAPLNPRWTKDGIGTVRLLITLAGTAHYVAACAGVRSVEKNVTTVKAHFAGTTRGGKDPVMARCRQLGWPAKNDNEADAGALWSLLKCETDPGFSYKTTPLLGGQQAEELARRQQAAREGA